MASPQKKKLHGHLSIMTDTKDTPPISLEDFRNIKARRRQSIQNKMDLTMPTKLNYSEDSISIYDNDENVSVNESRKKNPVAHILKSYREKIRENAQLKRENFLSKQQNTYFKEQIKVLNDQINTLNANNKISKKCRDDASDEPKNITQVSSDLDFDEVADAFLMGLEMDQQSSDYIKVQGLVKRARETVHDLKLEMEEWKMVYNKFQTENATLRKALSELNSAKKAYSSVRRSACLTKNI
jgi:FtsZ-binding cell division protein ZapB